MSDDLRLRGKVIALCGARMQVALEQNATGCTGCTSTGACGGSLIERWLVRPARVIEVATPSPTPAPGTPIELAIDESALLASTVIAYGLPVAGLCLGMALAPAAAGIELIAGAAGLGLGLWIAHSLLRRPVWAQRWIAPATEPSTRPAHARNFAPDNKL